MLVSIIIPCKNEEKRIGKTLEAVHGYLTKQDYEYEIIVVNNGSHDRTVFEVERRMKTIPHLRLITENAYGKGWAVHQGMLKAHGDWRLMTDADNSTDISHLGKFLEAGLAGNDVVISSRRLEESDIKNPQPWYRQILGNVFAGLVRTIVPTGVKDTQNGFKLFSREAVERIFPLQTIFYWAFDIEVLHLARELRLEVKELPITWIDDDRSHMNIKGMAKMLEEVLYVRWNIFNDAYSSKDAGESRNKNRIHIHAPAKSRFRFTLW